MSGIAIGCYPIYDGSVTGVVESLSATPTRITNIIVTNPNASDVYLQFFDVVSTSVILGTTAPNASLPIPASGKFVFDLQDPWMFEVACSYACTTTDVGAVSPGAAIKVNFFKR